MIALQTITISYFQGDHSPDTTIRYDRRVKCGRESLV